ncbi:glycosyltransferase family 2 protein [bacterium]|nr:glycosyltransferase family 2 protein [bacterium]
MSSIGMSVVIPVYNGEKWLPDCIEKTTNYLTRKRFNYEIIIVDDGSSDKTRELANSLRGTRTKILFNRVNLGKGSAVKKGVLAATKDLVLFMDVDMSTPIEELEKLARPIISQGYDIVIGSRALKSSHIVKSQPPVRYFLSSSIKRVINRIIGLGYLDTQCGFKIFKKEAAHNIFSRLVTRGFSFDVEVLLLAERLGYRVKEVGVLWRDREPSTLSLIKFLQAAREFRKIKILYKRRNYLN